MKNRWKGKVAALLFFLLISASVFLIRRTTVSSGPWNGMYSIFAPAWILIGMGGILLLVMPGLNRLRIFGGVLLSTTISLMTLRWRSTFAIRDSWIHLGLIRDGNYLMESRYPAFHSGMDMLSEVTGVSTDSLIFIASPFAVSIGTILLAAVAIRLTGHDLRATSVATVVLLPAIAVDFNDRPITFAAVLVLSLLWLSLAPFEQRLKSSVVIIGSIGILLYHPLILVLFILIVISMVACSYLSSMNNSLESIIGSPSQSNQFLTRHYIIASLGTIFVAYFFYWLAVGQRILVGTIIAVLTTSASEESPTESAENSVATLYEIPMHLQETLAMAAVVITTGLLAFAGFFLSRTGKKEYRFTTVASISATGCLIVVFIMVDLLSPTGFPAVRAVPLAPILLIPGAIIGLQHLDKTTNIVTPIFVVILLVGLVVMFPSPLTGTIQQSSTPSDVDRTEWLVNHQGGNPVIEAENTYEIAHAYYGSSRVDRLANNNKWNYQSTTREESYSWQVDHSNSDALVVIHDISRWHAADNGDQQELEIFEYESNKVYAGGNSDVLFKDGE